MRKGNRSSTPWVITAAATAVVGLVPQMASADYTGAKSTTTNTATNSYLTLSNWSGGINNVVSGLANGKLYFSDDYTVGASGLNLVLASGANFFTGGGTFDADGNNTATAAARTLTLNGNVTISGGGSFQFGNGSTAVEGLTVNLGGGVRTLGTAVTTSFNYDVTNGGLIKTGAGQLNVRGNMAFTGMLDLRQGLTDLATGATVATQDIRISSYLGKTSLIMTNNASGTFNRIADNGTISLYGTAANAAEITHTTGTNNLDIFETIGAVAVRTGLGTIVQGAAANAATKYTLTLGNVTRSNNGMLAIYGTAGAGTISSGTNRVFIDNGTTNGTSLFIGTATGSGAKNKQIIPWIMTSSTNALASLNTFFTYETGVGLRPLDLTSEYYTGALDLADADSNVRITAADTSLGNGETRQINSLIATAGITMGATARLTITSGALNLNGTVNGGTIDFGSAEGIIRLTNGSGIQSLNANLVNASNNTLGVTYYGGVRGDFGSIGGVNTYNGPTNFVSGSVAGAADIFFGTDGNGINNYWRLAGGSAVPDASTVNLHPGVVVAVAAGATEKIGGWTGGASALGAGFRFGSTASALVIGDGAAIVGKVVLDGGTIAPGLAGHDTTRVGTLVVGKTTVNGSAADIAMELKRGTIAMELGDGVNDRLTVSGGIDIASSGTGLVLALDLNGFTPTEGQQWTIINSISGTITDSNGGGLFASLAYDEPFTFAAAISGGNSVVVTVTNVPEPASLAGALLTAGTLLTRRRRRAAR